MNSLPFEVANNHIVVKIVGRIPNSKNFGGNKLVLVLYMFLNVRTPWTINHIANPIKTGFHFFLVVSLFELLIVEIKNHKVAAVVSAKISATNVGMFCIILCF
jgi:hypothetical protein